MKHLIAGSVRFRGLIIAAAFGLLIFGVVQLTNAPLAELPEFKPTVVEVQTEALGLSAEEVEQFITVPLEQDLLNGVAFLQDIESVSLPGLSSVLLTFEPGTDLLDARQVVNERLTQAVGVAGLPEVAKPPQMLQPLSSTNRAAIIRLSSNELSPIDISVLARWIIGPRLLGVEGVANVSTFGLRDRQLQVVVDPAVLQENGVTLSQVIRTTGNALEVSPLTYLEASKPGTGGFIDTTNQRLQVFHEQTIKTPDELALVPLEDEEGNPLVRDGRVLTVGDITNVTEDHQPLIGDALCSDGPCQLIVVEKFPEANTQAVADGLEEALDAMRPGMAGLDMDTSIYRPADYVTTSFANYRTAMIIGGVLALLVLALFLFNWRVLVITLVVVGTSLAAAVAVLLLSGQTLNVMLMAGLVLAVLIVIDDAVVDNERVVGRVRVEDDTGEVPLTRRVVAPLFVMRSSVLYAVLIIGVSTVPVFFMDGVAGAFLPVILTSYLLAVGASLFVALTVTPALTAALLDGARPSPIAQRLQRTYDNRMTRLVAGPATALLAVIIVAVGAISIAFLRPSLDPDLQTRDILVNLDAATGTSLLKMNEMTGDLVTQLADIPGVRTVGAHVGRAIMSDQVSNVNEAEIWVNMDSTAPYDSTLAAIEGVVTGNSELGASVLTHSQERIDELLRRTEHDIVVRVYGEDPAVLDSMANEVHQRLDRIDGVTDLRIDYPPEERTIQVTTDLQAAQAVGLKPGDIRRTAAIMLNGITVGNLFDEQKVFDVVVWGEQPLREDMQNLENLLIDTERFGSVRLGTVADVEIVDAPAEIRHESVATYLDVTAAVEGRSVDAVAAEVDSAIVEVPFPIEYHAELLGGFDARQNQRWLLAALWFTAVAFIFLLLEAAVNSWRLGAVVLLEMTVALAGGLIAIWITGGEIALGSVAGLFAVFGFAARQSILVIRRYQELQYDGIPFGPDLVIRGTRDRMMPMLTTVTATIVFLLPFAVRGRSIGFEIVQPMAVVIIGGLLATTLLLLFVVPSLFLRFGTEAPRSIWDEEEYGMTADEIAAATGTEVA